MSVRMSMDDLLRCKAKPAAGQESILEQVRVGATAEPMRRVLEQYDNLRPDPPRALSRTAPTPGGYGAGPSEVEQLMVALMRQAGVDMDIVERQAHLVEGRNFACDFAIRPVRIVIEVEGLTKEARTAGHQTIEGYGRNCEKYNRLAISGWMVLRFTSRQIRKQGDMVIQHVQDALAARRAVKTAAEAKCEANEANEASQAKEYTRDVLG